MDEICLNKIYCEDCNLTLQRMENNFIDLIITSPPYDFVRRYQNETYWALSQKFINELMRVMKPGGVIVWIVGDQTINGSESLTSFKQALTFVDLGFRLHDTMIYQKSGFNFPANGCYHQVFEYMFIFSKGKPKTFNPIKDRKNKYVGQKAHGKHRGKGDNEYTNRSLDKNLKEVKEYGMRTNVWYVIVGGGHVTKDKIAYEHPAIFPESLVKDHILSWSSEGDIVYDPFMGSGTTAKMSILTNRKFIGSEINSKYIDISLKRIEPYI